MNADMVLTPLQKALFLVGIFVLFFITILIRIRARVKIENARLEAIKTFAAQGKAVPEKLLTEGAPRRNKHPRRKGFLGIALGIGFMGYFLSTDPQGGGWVIGILFLLMGIGNLWFNRNS